MTQNEPGLSLREARPELLGKKPKDWRTSLGLCANYLPDSGECCIAWRSVAAVRRLYPKARDLSLRRGGAHLLADVARPIRKPRNIRDVGRLDRDRKKIGHAGHPSRTTSRGRLSSRTPRNLECRRFPCWVHSTKDTCTTSLGLTQLHSVIFSVVRPSPQRRSSTVEDSQTGIARFRAVQVLRKAPAECVV